MKKLNKIRFILLLQTLLMLVMMAAPSMSMAAQPTVELGTTASYAVLAGSGITNTGPTKINGDAGGDVGLSPGTVFTGQADVTMSGTAHLADVAALQAKDDLVTAYNDAAGRMPVTTISDELGGTTLTPGTYDSADGTFQITGTLTLDGQNALDPVFVFKTASMLTTAPDSNINLINGARYCRTFWQVGTSANLGTNSYFVGHIFAMNSITANTGATVQGQLLARNGAVTLDSNTIKNGFCATPVVPTTATLHVIKHVINDNSGIKTAANFNLHLKSAGIDVAGSPAVGSESPGTTYNMLPAGTYTVSEDADAGYIASYSGGDVVGSNSITLAAGDNKTVTVTNDDILPAPCEYTYTVTDNKAEITGYTGDGEDITIPDELGGVLVTSIGYHAFSHCTGIKSINIQPGVTNIGYQAFYGCTGLTTISLPDGLTNIDGSAFYDCSVLTDFRIPQEVTNIGENAFENCRGLTEISLPEGVTKINNNAFYGCTGLKSFSLPKGVTSIDRYAFYNCPGLKSISLPEGITSIGDRAFQGCSGLTAISIPEGVPWIGDCTFADCPDLTSISLPKGITSIGNQAFWNCTGLTMIRIPEGVTNIGYWAFYGCLGLTTISFDSGETTIDETKNTIPAYTTIKGYDLSTAQAYAANHSNPFTLIMKSIICPANATFDKKVGQQADITATLTLNGNTLLSIVNGTAPLVTDTDYTVSEDSVIIKESYLASQPLGSVKITFNFSAGTSQILVITVSDTTQTSETLTVSNPSTTGFMVSLTPPMTGLSGSDFVLKDDQNDPVIISDAATSDNGATYTIRAVLNKDQTYMFTAKDNGYDFGTAQSVVVPTRPTSVAIGRTATQSSEYAGAASRAVNGDTDGNYNHGSCSHTNIEKEAWWQVDLGSSYSIAKIIIWNRTDVCPERLSDFYVLVSDTPFTSVDLNTAKSQAGVTSYYTESVGISVAIPMNINGRYIRIQLRGTNYLTLAEVQVFSTADNLSETLTVSNPSTTGFTVSLTPPMAGISSSDFVLKDDQSNPVTITSAPTADSGATYAISAALSAGQTYSVTATDTVYDFGTAQSVVVPATQNSTISPASGSFDKKISAQANVTSTLTLNGNNLLSIANGAVPLVTDTDYTVSGDTITIKKEYLNLQAVGTTTLTVNFSAGSTQALTITVSDTTNSTTDECFIATAAFGSKFTWPVALLRQFRDQYLLTNTLGTAFVTFYYQHSPPIAGFIAGSQLLKMLVRVMLVPVIAIVYIVYHPMLMGAVLVLFIWIYIYRSRQRRRYVQG